MPDAATSTIATGQQLAGTATASAASGVAAASLWDVIGIGPAVLFLALAGTALGLLFTPPGGGRGRLFALAMIYTVISAALAVLLAEIPGLDFLKRIAPVVALLLAFFAQSAIPALRDAINARLKRTVGGEGDGAGGRHEIPAGGRALGHGAIVERHLGARRLKPQGNAPPLRTHPAAQMAERVGNRLIRRKQFEQARFGRRAMPEIAAHRLGQRFGVLAQQAVERAQATQAQFQRRIRLGARRQTQAQKARFEQIKGLRIVHGFTPSFGCLCDGISAVGGAALRSTGKPASSVCRSSNAG